MDPTMIEAAARRAREATAARNSVACWTVTRGGTGHGTIDPSTGDWTPPTSTTFNVNGFYRATNRPATKPRLDAVWTVDSPVLCVAAGEPLLVKDDTLVLKSGGDPAHAHRSWRVTGPPVSSSHAIHREYPIEEVGS